MNPETSVPVVSVRYLPTTPLELASPWGKRDDLELSRMRALSQALAASTITRARTRCSLPVGLVDVEHAVGPARCRSSVTSRAIAPVTSVSRPVASAGRISTLVEVKFAFTAQPRLHWPQ